MKKRKIRKQALYIIVLLIVIVCIIAFLLLRKTTKEESITMEYGDPFSESTLSSESIENLDTSKLVYEEGKDYLKVGTYQVTYQIGKEKHKAKITVEDTKAPEFTTKTDQVEVVVGNTSYDFTTQFVVEDASEVSVNVDTANVDFNTVGTYDASIEAKDAYDHSTKLDFKVNVVEEVDQDKIEPFYVNGIMVVNKKHPLAADYAPGENAEAGNQVRAFIKEMQDLGYNISSSYSGYRSYEYQASLYNSYVAIDGQAGADTYSARPGYSEHQSGYAFDLLDNNGQLVESAPEVKYIAENAWRYGFIVRYIKAKEAITGYREETWHIRYVGDQAKAIYDSGLTLEEYLGIEGGDYLNP